MPAWKVGSDAESVSRITREIPSPGLIMQVKFRRTPNLWYSARSATWSGPTAAVIGKSNVHYLMLPIAYKVCILYHIIAILSIESAL